MISNPALLFSVGMIRDGGSLAAIFQGTDGCEYRLFLQARFNKCPSGRHEPMGYEEPVILDRLTGRETLVTWQQAHLVLVRIRSLIEREEDRKWFEAMEETVLAAGALPGGVSRHFEQQSAYRRNSRAG